MHWVPANDASGNRFAWGFSFEWENSGSTPTKSLVVNTACFWLPKYTTEQFDWEKHQRDNPGKVSKLTRVLGPRQSESFGQCFPTIAEMTAKQGTDESYYIFARAKYKDVINDKVEHTTRVCIEVRYFFENPKVGQANLANAGLCLGNNNCADEDCDKKE
jgi:hypothetical protein